MVGKNTALTSLFWGVLYLNSFFSQAAARSSSGGDDNRFPGGRVSRINA